MRLFIDPSGGIAGDMFTAALISAGANFDSIRSAMLKAASKLGSAEISLHKTNDDCNQLNIRLKSERDHLRGSEAKKILLELFDEFAVKDKYRDFGIRATEILLKAEIKAHRDFKIQIKGDAGHTHFFHQDKIAVGHHFHNHVHEDEEESFLHEAQDIVIDMIGTVMGLQDLNIEVHAQLLAPVSVGGGTVACSHGILPVPAPAAQVILKSCAIEWQNGPIDVELSTPTGVSILAALAVKGQNSSALEGKTIHAAGCARGTKLLDIPPLKIYLTT